MFKVCYLTHKVTNLLRPDASQDGLQEEGFHSDRTSKHEPFAGTWPVSASYACVSAVSAHLALQYYGSNQLQAPPPPGNLVYDNANIYC
jgi:hypothetical protein